MRGCERAPNVFATASPRKTDDRVMTTSLPVAGKRLADEKILILDFGAQYAQLIARRVREDHVYCEIVRYNITAERVQELNPRGIILSGGPASVYAADAPRCDPRIFHLGIPILGICYGMQLACDSMGGRVQNVPAREFGRTKLHTVASDALLEGIPPKCDVDRKSVV